MANSSVTSAYEWFNGFMGLVLGILVGIFVLGVFFKRANTFGAFMGFSASSIVMILVKYQFTDVSIWSYSLISIAVSIAVGLLCSWLYEKITGKYVEPAQYTTFADFKTKNEEINAKEAV